MTYNTQKKPPVRVAIKNLIDDLRFEGDVTIVSLVNIIDQHFSNNNLNMAAQYAVELLRYSQSKSGYGEGLRILKRNIYTLHKLLSMIFVNEMEKFIEKELVNDYKNNYEEVEEVYHNNYR